MHLLPKVDRRSQTAPEGKASQRGRHHSADGIWARAGRRRGSGLLLPRDCPPHAVLTAHSLRSCPSLCGPMDCSPPGSSVPGALQARVLEWIAIPSFRGSSRPRDQTCNCCLAGKFFPTATPGKPHCLPYQGAKQSHEKFQNSGRRAKTKLLGHLWPSWAAVGRPWKA